LLRARRERPRSCCADERDEIAAFQVIELHSVPCASRAELQDIELALISQEVAERFYDLLAVGRGRPMSEVTYIGRPQARPWQSRGSAAHVGSE
jgi:hypothetical protein